MYTNDQIPVTPKGHVTKGEISIVFPTDCGIGPHLQEIDTRFHGGAPSSFRNSWFFSFARTFSCHFIKIFQGRQPWIRRISGQYSSLQTALLVLVIYYMSEFLFIRRVIGIGYDALISHNFACIPFVRQRLIDNLRTSCTAVVVVRTQVWVDTHLTNVAHPYRYVADLPTRYGVVPSLTPRVSGLHVRLRPLLIGPVVPRFHRHPKVVLACPRFLVLLFWYISLVCFINSYFACLFLAWLTSTYE